MRNLLLKSVATNQGRIPVYQPFLHGNEKKYVNKCLDSGWISSKGEFISKFEDQFKHFVAVNHAISVCNGTVALHLALLALGIKPEDEIIVPTLTYVASVNTIVQAEAKPVFVDSLSSTWQLDPEDVRRKLTSKTRGVMVVHLYGHPCEMKEIQAICKENNLFLIEDCAEAFGSYYQSRHVGTFGDVATYSFFGNKTLTTGEGGMVITNTNSIYEKASLLKSQAVSKDKHYWHEAIGYNYRMTNISAAIGLAQLEQIETILRKKREIAQVYAEGLKNLPLSLHTETHDVTHSYWMCSILLHEAHHRDSLRYFLEQSNIETRPFFFPAHLLPMYQSGQSFPIAESLSSRGINLPSWPELSSEQLEYIIDKIKEYFITCRQ